jgi:hypothetical protein
MASGKLGSNALTAATNVTVYTVPADTVAALNINMVNRSAGVTATVRLAVGTNASPANADYIEFGAQLEPGGVLERTSIAASAGERVVAWASTGDVTVRVHGLERAV